MPYSEKDREALRQLVSDPKKVYVMCEDHFYLGDVDKQPIRGCANCWRAYYFKQLADIPPAHQKQWLDELEQVLRKLIEASGVQGVQLYDHPRIEIEKDGLPDKDN